MEAKLNRLYYIDWLRVLAFGLLFIFHTLRPFDSFPWHIKNETASGFVDLIVVFLHGWRMYLIFFISGVGTSFILRNNDKKFFNNRLTRLLIPYFFGVLILIPPQKFYEAIHQVTYHGSYMGFLLQLPAKTAEGFSFSSLTWTGLLGYHLWYLAFLFILSLVIFPLLKYLQRNEKQIVAVFNYLTSSLIRFGLLLIPFIFLDLILRPLFPGYLNWADFAAYTLYFLFGFLFRYNVEVENFIRNNAVVFLNLGIVTWLVYLLNRSFFDINSIPSFRMEYFGILLLKNLNSLSWVLAFVGFSIRYLNFSKTLIIKLNRDILPFYILHQTVIVIIGYYVVGLQMDVWAKFSFLLVLSFISTVLAYRLLSRFKAFRFLLGIRTDK